MNISEYILKEVHPLSLENKVDDMLTFCTDLPLSHIHIVEEGILLGSIAESDIRTIENPNTLIKEQTDLIILFYAQEDSGILELLSLFAQHETNTLPVISNEGTYVGYYELSDILMLFSDSLFMHHEGVLLELEKVKKDFSISEAAQIVESNSAKLLGIYIQKETLDTVVIAIKMVSDDVNTIIQTFRRYNYLVLSQHKEDAYLKDLKDRSDYLQKYLNM